MSKNAKPVIEFVEAKVGYSKIFDAPVLASATIPKWYKEQDLNIGDRMVLDKTGTPARTIKACMPVFDLITAGYVIKCPGDILFQVDENDTPLTSWSVDGMSLVQSHSKEQFNKFSVPEGYHPDVALKFINPWIVRTPPGYSTLFMTPVMRDELPFYCVPAIVDTDKHPSPVNFPFFIKKGFEGIVSYETPMIQMIPFKREEWSHKISEADELLEHVVWQHAKRKLQNRYKTFFRTKKVWR